MQVIIITSENARYTRILKKQHVTTAVTKATSEKPVLVHSEDQTPQDHLRLISVTVRMKTAGMMTDPMTVLLTV